MPTETVPSDPTQIIELEMEPEEAATVVTPHVTVASKPPTTTTTGANTWLSAPKSVNTNYPKPVLEEKVIVWDCETTGLNPWEYRLTVASFWDLSLPVSEMITFADWDEEALIKEICEWLNNEAPDVMTGFNTAYDIRAIASRAMFYRQPCQALLNCRHDDTRDFMKKGTWKSVFSDQASGTLEDWALYLYDEAKPFTIEEIFADLDEGSLYKTVVRNRWDVYIEGQLYMLSKYCQFGEYPAEWVEKPPLAEREELEEAGIVVVPCPTCKTNNDFRLDLASINCYICSTIIPRPSGVGYLKEYTRPIESPGELTKRLNAEKAAAKKKTTTTAKA